MNLCGVGEYCSRITGLCQMEGVENPCTSLLSCDADPKWSATCSASCVPEFFAIFNIVVLCLFVVDIVLRILAYRAKFFKSWMNVFELLVILVCWAVVIFDAVIPVTLARALRPALRLSRLLRVVNCRSMGRGLHKVIHRAVNRTVRKLFKMLAGDSLLFPDENMCFDLMEGVFELCKVTIVGNQFEDFQLPITVAGGIIDHLYVNLPSSQILRSKKKHKT